ncbi:MAG TPA: hypothetical protein VKB54_09900 [Solirubrobacteraceae bacterium]|jgi:hypothetical protein|nr:hypothetical protein [Solirubrobacteraceae bacterium]
MGSPESDDRQRDLDKEVERYREAATAALEQLEWSVGYLRALHRPELANELDRNRKQILERMG